MEYYIKKPVIITAVQWKGSNTREIMRFCHKKGSITKKDDLVIYNKTGNYHVYLNDMIIKDSFGELSVCNPDIFETYYNKAVLDTVKDSLLVYIE